MRTALISIRETTLLIKQEMLGIIRKDIYEHVSNLYAGRMLTQDMALEAIAKAVVVDILNHTLLYQVSYSGVQYKPKTRLFQLLEPDLLPPRQPHFYQPEHAQAIYRQTAERFRVTNFTEDLHADIAEALFDRYFFELCFKVKEFIDGKVWNIFTLTFEHGSVLLTDTGEDFRIGEYMRLHVTPNQNKTNEDL